MMDGQINIDRPFQGSVLAPKATINVNQNLDGNIVADKVNVNAETHRWDLQDDDSDKDDETEFELAVTIPGELPDLPGEEENNGENIDKPDEEIEEDIDPDTGGLVEVDGGSEAEKPDTDDNENGNEEDNNGSEENNEGNEENTPDENTDNEAGLITNGGSEGNTSNENNNNLEDGLLSGVVGNNKDESQTPTTDSTTSTGTLPQTGETTGIMATIIGLILAAFAFILKTTRIKKED
ncbi:MAG TPA: hypothetical protein DEQ50_08375 [Lactobacillus sp.]|nr:hypothetical protein [Lactobacillus sp.]